MGAGNSLNAEQEYLPTWPGDVQCSPRGATIAVDAFNTVPAGVDPKKVGKNALPNSCTQICLPEGLSKIASRHGVRFGGTCFGTNEGVDTQVDVDGDQIPPDTPICPGFSYRKTGKTAGVQWFQYECEDGDVIDYGPPYK